MKSFPKPGRTAATVLVIAGSDSSSGAGIQVDLRTLAAMGLHAVSAITAVTAQSSCKVLSTGVVSAGQVARQLSAVVEDFEIGAVKIGMLGSASNIRVVAKFLRENRLFNIVLDPVLSSTSGAALLPPSSLKAFRDDLIPLSDVLTPNLPEAAVLLDRRAAGAAGARSLMNLGAKSVLLKGGHARGEVIDYFADANGVQAFRHERLPFSARGTGCALSSAIAARLATGDTLLQAVTAAEAILQSALRNSLAAGANHSHLLFVATPTNK